MTYMNLRQQDLLWAVRRLPKTLRHIMLKVGPELVVAGGYVRACVANEPINDVDCFAPSREKAEEWAKMLCKKPYETDNAFTCKMQRSTVQFIHRWTYKKPEEILESFDFTIAMAAIWFQPEVNFSILGAPVISGSVPKQYVGICDPDFYADLAAKRLVYTSPERNEDAGGSFLRVLKFYQRGYRIPLDSCGAVLSRLMTAVKIEDLHKAALTIAEEQDISVELAWERQLAKVLTGLLREVDPNVDPEHLYHLPSEAEMTAQGKDLTTAEEAEEADGE
jgi:hypothetical protein